MSGDICTSSEGMPHFELNERAEFLNCCEECSHLFGVDRGSIAGRRLDEFVDVDHGRAMLLALLDAYRGRTVKNVPLTIITDRKQATPVKMNLEGLVIAADGKAVKLKGTFQLSTAKRKPRA